MSDQPIKMDKPKVAGTHSIEVDVIADKNYSWCTCGLSQKQPFCDGSHKQIEGMPFRSLKLKFNAPEQASFCMCKQTQTPPFCDGSYNGCKSNQQ